MSAKDMDWITKTVDYAKGTLFNRTSSGEAINKIGKNGVDARGFGGIHGAYKNIKNGDGFFEGTLNAHKKAGTDDWNYGAIAGSILTAGAAVRLATGGGIYNDGNGNTDIAGVPFI